MIIYFFMKKLGKFFFIDYFCTINLHQFII